MAITKKEAIKLAKKLTKESPHDAAYCVVMTCGRYEVYTKMTALINGMRIMWSADED